MTKEGRIVEKIDRAGNRVQVRAAGELLGSICDRWFWQVWEPTGATKSVLFPVRRQVSV